MDDALKSLLVSNNLPGHTLAAFIHNSLKLAARLILHYYSKSDTDAIIKVCFFE